MTVQDFIRVPLSLEFENFFMYISATALTCGALALLGMIRSAYSTIVGFFVCIFAMAVCCWAGYKLFFRTLTRDERLASIIIAAISAPVAFALMEWSTDTHMDIKYSIEQSLDALTSLLHRSNANISVIGFNGILQVIVAITVAIVVCGTVAPAVSMGRLHYTTIVLLPQQRYMNIYI